MIEQIIGTLNFQSTDVPHIMQIGAIWVQWNRIRIAHGVGGQWDPTEQTGYGDITQARHMQERVVVLNPKCFGEQPPNPDLQGPSKDPTVVTWIVDPDISTEVRWTEGGWPIVTKINTEHIQYGFEIRRLPEEHGNYIEKICE